VEALQAGLAVSFKGDPASWRKLTTGESNALREGSLIQAGDEKFMAVLPEGAVPYVRSHAEWPLEAARLPWAGVAITWEAQQNSYVLRRQPTGPDAAVALRGPGATLRPVEAENAVRDGSLLRVQGQDWLFCQETQENLG
jgi:hypothetical protein